MFRNEATKAEDFKNKFSELMKKFRGLESIRLDSEYLRATQAYIDRLYNDCQTLDDEIFSDIKIAEMSNLNRLQKLKLKSSYKKDKHKHKALNHELDQKTFI